MTNRLRTEIEDEGELETVQPEAKDVKVEGPKGFFTTLLTEGVISKMMPFVIFLAMLGMVYIANMHFAEKNIRNIDKLNKEVKE